MRYQVIMEHKKKDSTLKKRALADVMHMVIQIAIGVLIIVGALVAAIALAPALGMLAWVWGAFIGIIGFSIIIDGLEG